LERELHDALKTQDPKGIAAASAVLASRLPEAPQIPDYLSYFVPYIKKQYQREEPVDVTERRSEVRQIWAEIRRDQKIDVRPVISDAVVQAVLNFLRRQGL